MADEYNRDAGIITPENPGTSKVLGVGGSTAALGVDMTSKQKNPDDMVKNFGAGISTSGVVAYGGVSATHVQGHVTDSWGAGVMIDGAEVKASAYATHGVTNADNTAAIKYGIGIEATQDGAQGVVGVQGRYKSDPNSSFSSYFTAKASTHGHASMTVGMCKEDAFTIPKVGMKIDVCPNVTVDNRQKPTIGVTFKRPF